MRLILNFLVVVLVLGSLQSCVSKKKYDELAASKEASDQALAETQAQVKELEEENAALESEMAAEKERLNNEMASIREDLQSTKDQMNEMEDKLAMTEKQLEEVKAEINGIFNSYQESGLTLSERDGRLYVLSEPVANYRSGSYGLSGDERSAIEELAETLKNNSDLKILVEGHTDDQGVLEGASYSDNWELSTKRALRIVRALIDNGANPDQVAAVGRGEYMPVGDNETSDGRAENRRTEILADPSLQGVIEATGAGNNE